MSTDYKQVTSALGNLRTAVNHAVQRDVQDIVKFATMAVTNPLYAPTAALVVADRATKIANLWNGFANADQACGGELERASRVVTVKEEEAKDRRDRARRFAAHSAEAASLRVKDTEWLGDASGLYCDTAEVCSRGLMEISSQFRNAAQLCDQIAQAHRRTYTYLAQAINMQSVLISGFAFQFVPFGAFFLRIHNAQAGLAKVVEEAHRAETGELVRDGLSSGGARARQVANSNEVLGSHDFRADPAMARHSNG